MTKYFKTLSLLLLILLTACTSGQASKPNVLHTPEAQISPLPNIPTQIPAQSQSTNKTAVPFAPKNHYILPGKIIPNTLWIPSVSIKAPIEPVKLLENGQMGVPESSEVAGLFIEGVLPGEEGNALIAGHVDNYTGPAIFYPLKRLKPGHPIILSDENGKYLVYMVDAVESYLTAEAPLDRIFGDTDKERLNIITCAGKYDRKKKEHEKRLVVYAHMLK
ncbi:class F sortase [Paenibacillus sp. NPDC058071]|uniref:class F sortase n=1 Tax=Paenibacillus sp. NPDC058071 TaxID=3346326 RepID=UPI0036DD4E4E